MGIIILPMMGLVCVVAVLSLIRLIVYYRRKELGRNIFVYGILLSVFLHIIIFCSYLYKKDYWAFSPIFTQMDYLFFKPFLFSMLTIPFEFEKPVKSNKVILSGAAICCVIFSLLILSPYMVGLYILVFIFMAFLKVSHIRNMNKIILVSIISSLIICGFLMPVYDKLLAFFGAKLHY